jgi:hypothetical protein
MRNASHAVARQGYAFYLSASPRPSIDEVNAHLQATPAVAPRTYDHYGRLDRMGLKVYLSVNEFDMRKKLGALP